MASSYRRFSNPVRPSKPSLRIFHAVFDQCFLRSSDFSGIKLNVSCSFRQFLVLEWSGNSAFLLTFSYSVASSRVMQHSSHQTSNIEGQHGLRGNLSFNEVSRPCCWSEWISGVDCHFIALLRAENAGWLCFLSWAGVMKQRWESRMKRDSLGTVLTRL